MTTSACINEIFSSLQGEGSHVGEKMTFVRFSNCTLGCQWCDTDHNPNKACYIYDPGSEAISRTAENPVTLTQLIEIIDEYSDRTVAITGGEPLEEAAFLTHLLPAIHQKKRILLETNGIFYNELKRLVENVDIISMDIKLPSSTGREPFWQEHQMFLTAALESGKETYVKLVVTSSTTDKDINEAIKLISTTNRYIPVYLQPVTPTEAFPEGIPEERLASFKRLFGAWLPNVSVASQMHKEWNVK